MRVDVVHARGHQHRVGRRRSAVADEHLADLDLAAEPLDLRPSIRESLSKSIRQAVACKGGNEHQVERVSVRKSDDGEERGVRLRGVVVSNLQDGTVSSNPRDFLRLGLGA